MKEIRRIIMGYAWEVARRQAKFEGCTARECFAWALAKAWKEFKHCDRCSFDIHITMEAVEEYEKRVLRMNEIKFEVREIKTPDGKKIYGVFEHGKTGMIDYSPSKSYAERTAKYYTNFMKSYAERTAKYYTNLMKGAKK